MPSAEAVERITAARCRRREGIDVLVVGGGVAGMSAALAAAEERASVLLLQRGDHLGGRCVDDPRVTGAGRLLKEVAKHDAIEVLTGAEAIGWYEEGTIAVDTRPDLLLVDPSAVVLATGAYELGLPFPNCDLPGVMVTSGAQRLLGRHRVRPGSTVVLVTSDDLAYGAGLQFVKAGIEVACVADYRRSQQIDQRAVRDLTSRGVTALAGVQGVHVKGFTRVTSLSLRDAAGASRRYRCEVVCVSGGFRAADELARQALSWGNVTLSMPATFAGAVGGPRGLTPHGPWLAGQAGGARSFAAAVEQGQAAGRAAALRAQHLA